MFDQAESYKIGDKVTMSLARSWLDIWLDRVTSLRWDVPRSKPHTFECISTVAGAVWPTAIEQRD